MKIKISDSVNYYLTQGMSKEYDPQFINETLSNVFPDIKQDMELNINNLFNRIKEQEEKIGFSLKQNIPSNILIYVFRYELVKDLLELTGRNISILYKLLTKQMGSLLKNEDILNKDKDKQIKKIITILWVKCYNTSDILYIKNKIILYHIYKRISWIQELSKRVKNEDWLLDDIFDDKLFYNKIKEHILLLSEVNIVNNNKEDLNCGKIACNIDQLTRKKVKLFMKEYWKEKAVNKYIWDIEDYVWSSPSYFNIYSRYKEEELKKDLQQRFQLKF